MAEGSIPTVRRHDIDWLRVILFGLLIPFHVAIGIYWSTYGEDVNPNIGEIAAVDGREFAEESDDYSAESVDFTSMVLHWICLLYTSPSPRDKRQSRMPSSA